MKAMHRAACGLTTTDELIEHYAATTDIPVPVLGEVVKAGIDTLYGGRDAGGNMHSSGAAAAVEAVLAYRAAQASRPRLTPERLREGDWHDESGPRQIGGEDIPTRAEIAREDL